MALKVLVIVLLLIVALVVVRAMFLRRGREPVGTGAGGRRTSLSKTVDASDLELEIIRLLAQRKKILAIKVLRQHTKLGLKEAKDVVEDVERTGRLVLPDVPPRPYAPGEVMEHARRLKRQRRAIDAIKLIREHTGLGLREAKNLYDDL